MNRLDNIISNFSAYIIMGFRVRHDSSWCETCVKTNYTLWAIEEGTVYIEIDNKKFTAHKGDAVLFYPENAYRAYTNENGCKFIAVRFSLKMGADMDLLSEFNLAGIVGNIKEETHSFCTNFMQNHRMPRRTSFEHYIEFIKYIHKITNIQKNDSTAILFYHRTHTSEKAVIQLAIDYISHNYKHISVKDVAKYVHMNEKRFILNFKKAVNLSPGQYIHRCKMQKAAELLSISDIKITDIAQELGFADQYSFSKAFKRTYGEAPTIFRNNSI